MIPIVSIVGRSDSGKTFLIEKLIPLLVAKGYRVATVKHGAHGFDIDREGKDSWRHKEAGAATVVLSSPDKLAVIKKLDNEQSLEEIRGAWIRDADIILSEGYKRSPFPRIEVSLFEDGGELLSHGDDRLIALVSNRPQSLDLPVFRDNEIEELSSFLEERFLRIGEQPQVELFLSGTPMDLDSSVQGLLWNAIRGLVCSLKGWDPKADVVVNMSGQDSVGES